MVYREVAPCQWAFAPHAAVFLFTIPEESPLLGRERSLLVRVLEEGSEQSAEDLGTPLAVGGAICVALNGQQVTCIELLGLLSWSCAA